MLFRIWYFPSTRGRICRLNLKKKKNLYSLNVEPGPEEGLFNSTFNFLHLKKKKSIGSNILSSYLCFLVMHETLECSSDSADWITTVGTVGSQLWELRGAVPSSAVTQHEGR